ncbi:hypothetical protein QT383_19805 [Stenotrophomonas rhizophila]
MLFSTQPETRDAYQRLFRERRIEKTYEALAQALPDLRFPLERNSRLQPGEPFFRMVEGPANRMRGPVSRSSMRTARSGATGLCRNPDAKHQLRVHMAALGAPILGDGFYPQLQDRPQGEGEPPLQLLAQALALMIR